jgi:hypothetical protein
MNVNPSMQDRVFDKASGVAKLASMIEVLGWAGLLGALIVTIVIGSHDVTVVTSTLLGNIKTTTETQWPLAIGAGVAIAIMSLIVIAVARGLALFALYASAQMATR